MITEHYKYQALVEVEKKGTTKEFVCLIYHNECSNPDCDNIFIWPCGKIATLCPDCRYKKRLEKEKLL